MKQSWILSRANSPAKRPWFWAIPHSPGVQYALKYQSNTCNQTQSDNQLNNAKWYLLFEWAVVITIHSADWFLLLLLLSSTRWWLVGQHSRLPIRHSKCCSPLTLLLIRTDFVSLLGNMQSIFCKLIVLLLIDNHVSGSVPYGKFNESFSRDPRPLLTKTYDDSPYHNVPESPYITLQFNRRLHSDVDRLFKCHSNIVNILN